MNESQPRRLGRAAFLFAIGCAVMLLLDAVIHRHAETELEGIFGFYSIYGFISIVVLVFLAKGLRRIVAREEHYYGD